METGPSAAQTENAPLTAGAVLRRVQAGDEEPQTELLDPPSPVEGRLGLRIIEIGAAQVVEDDDGTSLTLKQGRYRG